jgi:PIN like domain
MPAKPRRSRKPSVASSSSRQPEPPVFFIDRSLGKHVVAGVLRASGLRVEVHDDHFKLDETDEFWLGSVGARGWVVLTKDYRLRYRALALRAIEAGRVRVFVLKKSEDLRADEMAVIFAAALPAMQRLMQKILPPFVAKVGRDRRVELWWGGLAMPDVK